MHQKEVQTLSKAATGVGRNRKGGYANGPHLDGLFTHLKSEHTVCKTICSNREEITLTRDISSTVSVLLQDVTISTAAAMGANPVLTQLVTHAPH